MPLKADCSSFAVEGFLFGGFMKKIMLRGKRGKGKFALIDDEDFEIVSLFDWQINRDGYVFTDFNLNGKRKKILLHRMIMNASDSQWLDHKSSNRLDNRKCKLRFCTPTENACNRLPNNNCISKYKGVNWSKSRKKWRARIQVNGKRIDIGLFHEETAAAQAYDIMARELHGEFAHYNFI